MDVDAESLDDFVSRSDALGGPGAPACQEFWRKFSYHPTVAVDQSLDPFGEGYVAAQLKLYEELSGRRFDQTANEHTAFDLERHVSAVNPYDHAEPGGLAAHLERLSRAIRMGKPPRGGRLLDMGCGWGLSSELAAYCGVDVLAVDLNPDFVRLVNARTARRGAKIHAVASSFDDFRSPERFDMILFYECLHHALRPWTVVEAMATLLGDAGKLVLAGEPINSHWWTHWGLRLDPLSVFCIRKFGWFESGWSAPFLSDVFERAGLTIQFEGEPDDEVGIVVAGGRAALGRLSADEIWRGRRHQGWAKDGRYMTSLGPSRLRLVFPPRAKAVRLELANFRGRPLRLELRVDGSPLRSQELGAGLNTIELQRNTDATELELEGEVWSPFVELGSSDARLISFNLEGVTFV